MATKTTKGAKAPSTTETPKFLLTGHIVNSERLATHYETLKNALPPRLRRHANIDEFLRSLSEVVDNSETSALSQNAGTQDTVAPPSRTRDTAADVVNSATHLMKALSALRNDALIDFEGQFVGALHAKDRDQFRAKLNDASTPKHEIFGDAFLAKLWCDLELLNKVALLLAEDVIVAPHNQPSKAHAREIARGAATSWNRCFGQMPKADPADAKKTSFTKFLRVLAEELRSSADSALLQSLYTAEFAIGATVAHDAIGKIRGG
jgi:hypothetical protein